jgi:hypothetical protein
MGIHEPRRTSCRFPWIALSASHRKMGTPAGNPIVDWSVDRGHLGPAGVAV